MPVNINGNEYYRVSEVCKLAGISRATLLRWLKAGLLGRVRRDRRGWRLFSRDDLDKIIAEATKIEWSAPL